MLEKVLEFFNTVNDPYEIRHRIKDDPNFSTPSTSGYGISLSVAKRILEARDNLPGGRFDSIQQIDDVKGMGAVTLHNILYSFWTGTQDFMMIKSDLSFDVLVTPGKWGSRGAGDGQFNDPRGIAVDGEGNVYVGDRNNNRIQKFRPDYVRIKSILIYLVGIKDY